MVMTEEEKKERKNAYMREYNKRPRTEEQKAAQREYQKEVSRRHYQQHKEEYSAYAKAYYQANKEQVGRRTKAWASGNKERLAGYSRKYQAANMEKALFRRSKRGAKRAGREFNIELSDIIIPSHCPVLGIPLVRKPGNRDPELPSLDRVDSSKGYVKGNVRVISWRANQLKSDATMGELLAVYEYMLDHHTSQDTK